MGKALISCFLLLMLSGCYPGTWLREMTYNGPALYRAALSRDGKKIAFFYALKAGDIKGIYISDIYGNNPELLVEANISAYCMPVFTPDDKEIIYYSYEGQFFKVNIENKKISQITGKFAPSDNIYDDISAVYISQNCKIIKFQKNNDCSLPWESYRTGLFIFDVEKNKTIPFPFPEKQYFEYAWGQLSPDGLKIVFYYDKKIYALLWRENKLKELVHLKKMKLEGSMIHFAISSDSRNIAYITNKGIFIVDIETGKSQLVYDFQGKQLSVDTINFTPDGNYLLFDLVPYIFESPPSSGFYRLDLKTKKLEMLTKSGVFYYVVSDNSQNILYRSFNEKTNHYYIIDIDGKNKREVILRPKKIEKHTPEK